MKPKAIGIVGGAGPMAGALLTKKIIQVCQETYECVNDSDFPRIILLSTPFAEMLRPNTRLQKESEVSEQLNESLNFLMENGADCIGIACNTLHVFLDPNDSRKPLVNLIEITEQFLTEQNFSKVLVLSTSTSSQKNAHNFISKVPLTEKDQFYLDDLIRAILGGLFSSVDAKKFEAFLQEKIGENSSLNGIVLGCTEFSVLNDQFPLSIPGIQLTDPLDLLAEKLCAKIFNKEIKKCL